MQLYATYMQLYATNNMQLYATLCNNATYATILQLYETILVPQTYIGTINYLLVLMSVGTTK